MLKLWVKHKLAETAINQFFNKLSTNFKSNRSIFVELKSGDRILMLIVYESAGFYSLFTNVIIEYSDDVITKFTTTDTSGYKSYDDIHDIAFFDELMKIPANSFYIVMASDIRGISR